MAKGGAKQHAKSIKAFAIILTSLEIIIITLYGSLCATPLFKM